jgi:hypothetical protein
MAVSGRPVCEPEQQARAINAAMGADARHGEAPVPLVPLLLRRTTALRLQERRIQPIIDRTDFALNRRGSPLCP